MLNAVVIDHINFYVKNLQQSVEFYKQLFGFTLHKDQPEDKSKIIGNENIKFCLYEKPEGVKKGGINHFGIYIENFDQVVAKCKSLNIPMPYGVVNWGQSRSVYIQDPNGYEIELSEINGGGL